MCSSLLDLCFVAIALVSLVSTAGVHHVDDPLFPSVAIDADRGGLVVVQTLHRSTKGVVCVSNQLQDGECQNFGRVLCPFDSIGRCSSETFRVSRELSSSSEAALHSVSCGTEAPPPMFLSMCTAATSPDNTSCPEGQSPLHMSCSRLLQRKREQQSVATNSGVVVYSTVTSIDALVENIAAMLAVSVHRINLTETHRFGTFCYGQVSFNDLASSAIAEMAAQHRFFVDLADADSAGGVTTTSAPTSTTTTVAPTTTTTTTAAPPTTTRTTTTTTTVAPRTAALTTMAATTTKSPVPTTVAPTTSAASTQTAASSTRAPTTATTTIHPTNNSPTSSFTSSPQATGTGSSSPSTPSAPPSTTPVPSSPQSNDDMPSEILFQLLSVVSVASLTDAGIYELRVGTGESQCDRSGNRTLIADNTHIRCLDTPNATDSAPLPRWFASKLAVIENTTGLVGTVCGGGWSDSNATYACRVAAQPSLYPRGYVVRHFDDSRQNQWPILATLFSAQTTGPTLSGCFSKRNNCTHADDAGVVCSQSQYSNHYEYFRFYIAMEFGTQSLVASLPAFLLPSSKTRINITTMPTNSDVSPFGNRFSNASNVSLFAMEFTAICDDIQPSRNELEQMFLLINSVGLDKLGIIEVNATQLLLTVPDCPISYTKTVSASDTITTIAVYLRVREATNVTNVTETLQRLLGISYDLSVVVISPVLFAVYFPSAALALSAVEIASSGILPGVLAASFFQDDESSDAPAGSDSNNSNTTVIVIVVVVAAVVVAVVAGIILVKKRASSSSSGSATTTKGGSAFALDGEMNTLFLPINLDDLEEWQPPARQSRV